MAKNRSGSQKRKAKKMKEAPWVHPNSSTMFGNKSYYPQSYIKRMPRATLEGLDAQGLLYPMAPIKKTLNRVGQSEFRRAIKKDYKGVVGARKAVLRWNDDVGRTQHDLNRLLAWGRSGQDAHIDDEKYISLGSKGADALVAASQGLKYGYKRKATEKQLAALAANRRGRLDEAGIAARKARKAEAARSARANWTPERKTYEALKQKERRYRAKNKEINFVVPERPNNF